MIAEITVVQRECGHTEIDVVARQGVIAVPHPLCTRCDEHIAYWHHSETEMTRFSIWNANPIEHARDCQCAQHAQHAETVV